MKLTKLFLCIAIVAWFPLSSGCSFSYSSKSISESVSGSSKSSGASSKSSSPEDAQAADVRDFTAAHVQSGGDVDGLTREIGALSQKNGVTDWESDESTFRGVGAGLAKAGRRQVEVDAFKNNLTSTPEQGKWLQAGYDSAK